MRILIPVFVVALLLAYGCDSGSDSVSDAPVDLNGDWLGVAVVTGGTAYPPNTSYPIVMALVQSGTAVTGDYNTAAVGSPTSGTVAGTVSGRTFTFTLTEDTPCGGTFNGAATVDGASISFNGSYSGADCSGTTQAGFSASK